MKWFKHDSNATGDAKLEKLMARYGLEGYGLYFYCLELVARNVDKHNLTFELEHDAEVISRRVGLHFEVVQDMMRYMVELRLFEDNNGSITCLKMATRTDEYTQKLLNGLQKQQLFPTCSRECPDTIGRKSELIEENRTEEKEKHRSRERDHSGNGVSRFDEWWSHYPKKRGKADAKKAWKTRKLDASADSLIADVQKRQKYDQQWKKGFVPNPGTYLRGERWEDELSDASDAEIVEKWK